jgi:hypothetical protein
MTARRATSGTKSRTGAAPAASRRTGAEPEAWVRLSTSLAEALSALGEGQCLVLSAKRRGAWVHFVVGGSGGIYAEAASNEWLKPREALDRNRIARMRELGWSDPAATRDEVEASDETLDRSSNFSRGWRGPAPLAEVAATAIATLREVYGLRRSSQLEYTAFGPGLKEILLPTLGLDNAPLPDEDHEHEHSLLEPENRDELFLAVSEAIQEVVDPDGIVVDEDGDIPLRMGSALIFLRVADDAPYIELFSPLVKGVEPSLDLFAALNEISRHNRQVAAFIAGDSVFASLELIADPFVPAHLNAALAVLGNLCEEAASELQQRFGGRRPFDEAPRKRSRRRRVRYN